MISIDNRQVFAGLLSVAIAGGIIMSDWQAIGTDPCSVFCNKDSYSFDACATNFEELNHNPFLNFSANEISDFCINASTSEDTCYWNPQSRITGKYCSDCTQRCSSIQKSLYFSQLCIGLMLTIFVLQITPLFVNIIASDFTPTEYQVFVM